MSERNVPEGGVPAELAELDAEMTGFRKATERKVDPGTTAMGVTAGVLLLVISLVLPWTGSVQGWTVLAGTEWIGPLPRLFAFVSMGIGVVLSTLTLSVRWWALAWACAAGSGISTIMGVWAIWSRQTTVLQGGTGPGIGLVVALVGVVVLVVSWARIAGRRFE
jgi:hypothetical protein